MHLYLLRHGIAIDRDDPACPRDSDRELTERGVERTRAAVLGLRRMGVVPDLIVTSPYARARRTADIAAEFLEGDAPVRETPLLMPAQNPAHFFAALPRFFEMPGLRVRRLLGVGHNPHLNDVLAAATGRAEAFTWLKKAGCACVEFEDGHPIGTLQWLHEPKTLRRLGRAE